MKNVNSIITSLVFCVAVFFSAANSYAQSEMSNEHIVKSNFNGKSYQLNVSLPKSYSKLDTLHYPVLYVLDGKFSYHSFNSIREVLDLAREIKDVIIVAIEGEGTTDADWFASRYADFTPSNLPQADTQWAKMMNIPEGKLKSGGAELFLNTLQKDLMPFIDKNYKTTTKQGISGHSLGGLFAGYCLIKKPDLFKNYGINSPSFWWNNNEMVTIENTCAKENTTISANVFFSAGALEGDMMISPMNAFMNALKSHNYKGLQITSHIFEDETHISVVAACSSRTLKVLFGANVK
jgi:predicted alpha/beta superfamily hydrolase